MSAYDYLDKDIWVNRVILLFASNGKDENLKAQLQSRQNDPQGYRERDIKLYLILAEAVFDEKRQEISKKNAAEWRQRFKVSADEFALILLGKDGTVKTTKFHPISNRELFEVIDSMPMRQKEMGQ